MLEHSNFARENRAKLFACGEPAGLRYQERAKRVLLADHHAAVSRLLRLARRRQVIDGGSSGCL
jgi:hypothetical protein